MILTVLISFFRISSFFCLQSSGLFGIFSVVEWKAENRRAFMAISETGKIMHLTPRQYEIHDFLVRYFNKNGYAPTIAEIQEHLSLKSPASVHEHLTALEQGGLIRRLKNISRGIEIVQNETFAVENELPLLGLVAAGSPILAVLNRETVQVTPDLYSPRRFALRVRGDSMRDEHIADGDCIIVEPAETARNGQTVVALVNGTEATVKKFYQEKSQVRLQPANDQYKPIIVKDPNYVVIQGHVVGLIRKY